MSPVLAQTFTDHFTVYSAKRFPGVPGTSARSLRPFHPLTPNLDTTALSIAFGNQGQKLPLVSPKFLFSLMEPSLIHLESETVMERGNEEDVVDPDRRTNLMKLKSR